MQQFAPPPPVIIVGGGMAGLTAALSLFRAGRPVRLYEAGDTVGGRLKSRVTSQGFILDEGFQVLLDAYPAPKRWVEFPELSPRSFDAGALVWTGRRRVPVANPLRHPAAIVRDITTRLFPPADKLRLAALAAEVVRAPWQSANEAATSLGRDRAAVEYFWERGFSERFINHFARPFFGGITFDPHLSQSIGPSLFTLKMFLEGSAVLPAAGVAALPAKMADQLPVGAITTNARVDEIIIDDGRATGVRIDGQVLPAAHVIVATGPATAARLTPLTALQEVQETVGGVTVYLAGARRPPTGPRLVLDGTRSLLVNEIAPLSEVQPAYAPPGRHLLAAQIIGHTEMDLHELSERARLDVATMLQDAPGSWEVIDIIPTPNAQYAQPPGIYRRLPANVTAVAGLTLASEATVDSSYNGATISGETAAAIVNRELAFRRV
ncbi:MAG: FAD-dependent oxidoreductase [Chloroflexota bacterium]|nr:FAD-dependent oxidoreductase [Chloroflexota bacterium]